MSNTPCPDPGTKDVTTAQDWTDLKAEVAQPTDAENMRYITTLVICPAQESTPRWQGPTFEELQLVLTCSKLTRLEKLELSRCNGLKQLPTCVTSLEQLKHLVVCNCSQLEQLPPSLETLSKLESLVVTTCKGIRALPEGLLGSQHTQLTTLTLRGCECLQSLPSCIGQLPALETLDLSYCHSLEEFPEFLKECNTLRQVTFSSCWKLRGLCPGLLAEAAKTGRDTSIWMKDVIKKLEQHRSIIELANNQQRMLETLERMSWIAVLLATATFIGFLQPPHGALKDDDFIEWSSAVQAFFVLDTWSFLTSLASLVMIVVLSLPRLQSHCKKREAGRFWLLLVPAWFWLYLAVITGCGAFVASAFTMYDRWSASIWGPTCLGVLLLSVGGMIGIQRFANLYPGLESIALGLAEIWQKDLPFHMVLPCDGLLACISCQSYWLDQQSQPICMQRQPSDDLPSGQVAIVEASTKLSCVAAWNTFLERHNLSRQPESLNPHNSTFV